MQKILFFDLETTGVDPKNCAIHQLSAILEIDGRETERINILMKPHDGAMISPEALAIAGKTIEDIQANEHSQETGYSELTRILARYCDKFNKKDKIYLAGFNNAGFDNFFLREFFTRNKDNYFGSWFWANCLDVYVLATPILFKVRPEMGSFKLKDVAAKFGAVIDESRLHDGMYDIELTKFVYDIYKTQYLQNY